MSEKTKAKVDEINKLVEAGMPVSEAVNQIGIASSTYYAYQKQIDAPKKPVNARVKTFASKSSSLESAAGHWQLKREVVSQATDGFLKSPSFLAFVDELSKEAAAAECKIGRVELKNPRWPKCCISVTVYKEDSDDDCLFG